MARARSRLATACTTLRALGRIAGIRRRLMRAVPSRPQRSSRTLDAIAAEACREDCLEVGLRAGARQVEIGFAERVDQRADDMGAADRDAARRANVGTEPVEEYDLPIEQDHGHLGP